ncbi:hypothetical protein NQZ68_022719 [Dissostichus eleginoides]|nr:hypothetical protein NQZ68_022719 [Dissostichus eleginoides]
MWLSGGEKALPLLAGSGFKLSSGESHSRTIEKLSGKLSEYGLIVPFSTDSQGRYISHVVSAGSGSNGDGDADADAASAFSSSSRRVARSAPEMPPVTPASTQHLFFNVTVFGKELHLRLRANRRLVAPGAFVEWHEDFVEKAKERIHGDCVFTGDVSDMPEASVAISNCDGLILLHCIGVPQAADDWARIEPV